MLPLQKRWGVMDLLVIWVEIYQPETCWVINVAKDIFTLWTFYLACKEGQLLKLHIVTRLMRGFFFTSLYILSFLLVALDAWVRWGARTWKQTPKWMAWQDIRKRNHGRFKENRKWSYFSIRIARYFWIRTWSWPLPWQSANASGCIVQCRAFCIALAWSKAQIRLEIPVNPMPSEMVKPRPKKSEPQSASWPSLQFGANIGWISICRRGLFDFKFVISVHPSKQGLFEKVPPLCASYIQEV